MSNAWARGSPSLGVRHCRSVSTFALREMPAPRRHNAVPFVFDGFAPSKNQSKTSFGATAAAATNDVYHTISYLVRLCNIRYHRYESLSLFLETSATRAGLSAKARRTPAQLQQHSVRSKHRSPAMMKMTMNNHDHHDHDALKVWASEHTYNTAVAGCLS